MNEELFNTICNTMVEDFNLAAFDRHVAALEDGEFKELLQEERADAVLAFQDGNDDWLRARLQAMARLLTLLNFSVDAKGLYRKAKAANKKQQFLIDRDRKRLRGS